MNAKNSSHADTANTMNHLVLGYQEQTRFAEAEVLARQALAMHEQHVGANHILTSRSLTNLGVILRDLGHHQEAEQLLM
jgi:hypothetical protein